MIITIHHSATPVNTTITAIDKMHKDRFNMKSSLGFYIGYHYLIASNGNITQTRKDTEIGAHVANKNKNNIGICLIGNFEENKPTDQQIYALRDLLKKLVKQYDIKNIYGHKELAATACPGKHISMDFIRNLAEIPTEKEVKESKEAVIKRIKELLDIL